MNNETINGWCNIFESDDGNSFVLAFQLPNGVLIEVDNQYSDTMESSVTFVPDLRIVPTMTENDILGSKLILDEKKPSRDVPLSEFTFRQGADFKAPLSLYLIWQEDTDGYDLYLSAVVCASSMHEAKYTSPNKTGAMPHASEWPPYTQVRGKRIGAAAESMIPGVVCTSYRNG